MSRLTGGRRDQVVVVSLPLDRHTDVIIDHLERHDVEVVRLHLEDLCGGVEFSHRLGPHGSEGTLRVVTSDRTLQADRLRAVWWRRLGDYVWPEAYSEAERAFAEREIQQALRGFLDASGCRWVSHPEAITAASWKPEQLARASGLGFTIPRTLVATRRHEIVDFFEECEGHVVYKVMGDPFLGRAIGPDGPITTRPRALTRDDLAALQTVEPIPCQVQQRIPKARELRVTIVGRQVFTAAVTPFTDSGELLDWRGHEAELHWQAWDLARTEAQRCLALVESYGLRYGAIDLILTPEGDHVFLELNPAGQFLFVEHLVPNLKLGEAFAAYLADGDAR